MKINFCLAKNGLEMDVENAAKGGSIKSCVMIAADEV